MSLQHVPALFRANVVNFGDDRRNVEELGLGDAEVKAQVAADRAQEVAEAVLDVLFVSEKA